MHRRVTDAPHTIRTAVLDRDEHRCRNRIAGRVCGRPAYRIRPLGNLGDHRIELLQAQCDACHAKTDSGQG